MKRIYLIFLLASLTFLGLTSCEKVGPDVDVEIENEEKEEEKEEETIQTTIFRDDEIEKVEVVKNQLT